MSNLEAVAPLPDNFPHIFTEVAFELLPEIDYDKIVHLSALVNLGTRQSGYSKLVDALRKIQWAKLSGLTAAHVENVLIHEPQDLDVAFQDPIGQITHAKSLLDFISQGKAALDSLSVFLNDLFSMGFSGGQRDLRHSSFRTKLANEDLSIGSFLSTEAAWLDVKSSRVESILAVRDEWLHRDSPSVALMWPPSEVGALPIPKELRALIKTAATKDTHYSTQEFLQHHFSRLLAFFDTVTDSCIKIETKASTQPTQPLTNVQRLSAVKVCVTKTMHVAKLRIGPFTAALKGVPVKGPGL